MYLAKQTVELAQHALRKHDLGLQAAKYLLHFGTVDEADARLAFSVIQASEDLNEERQGLVLLARGGFAKADYQSLVNSMGDTAEYRGQSKRITTLGFRRIHLMNIERTLLCLRSPMMRLEEYWLTVWSFRWGDLFENCGG